MAILLLLGAVLLPGHSRKPSDQAAVPQAGPSPSPSAAVSVPPLSAQVITIQDQTISPPRLTVRAGTKIVWLQKSSVVQTVTSVTTTVDPKTKKASPAPDGRFASGTLRPGTSYSVTLTQPGIYTYLSTLHPGTTQGTIIVE